MDLSHESLIATVKQKIEKVKIYKIHGASQILLSITVCFYHFTYMFRVNLHSVSDSMPTKLLIKMVQYLKVN